MGIVWLDLAEDPARVDRVGCWGAGSRGSQDDRPEADDGRLVNDDPLDRSVSRRIPAERCSESDNRCKITETPVLLWAHVSLPYLADVTACGLPSGRHWVCNGMVQVRMVQPSTVWAGTA